MANRNETFVTIEGFENYSISNKGKILSYTKCEDGRLLKPQKDAMGYLHVRLYDGSDIRGKYANGDSKPKLEKVHRLVAQHFLPEPDKDIYQEVNHIDGNKQNNDVTNLEWMTRMENIHHAWKTGLNEKGRREGAVKRRHPVKITRKDGTIEYFSGKVQASFYMGVTPHCILAKIKSQSYGLTGFKVENVDYIPTDYTIKKLEEVEQKIRDYNYKYYSKVGKNLKKKLADK